MHTTHAIILGGGIGSRMASPIPKQLMILKGLPVIMHSIKAFYDHNPQTGIVLVLHPDYVDQWPEILRQHKFSIPHQVIGGGSTRFDSVFNGLQYIWNLRDADDPVIAIHDGVRPLLTKHLIDEGYRVAFESGTAVPVIKSSDSVRMIDEKGCSTAINREKLVLVQTPQTFRSSILKKAYNQVFDPAFTDDASVVEKTGYPIRVIEGDIRNIKVTYQADLVIADKLLELA